MFDSQETWEEMWKKTIEKKRKIKNEFRINKLFLHAALNIFYIFFLYKN